MKEGGRLVLRIAGGGADVLVLGGSGGVHRCWSHSSSWYWGEKESSEWGDSFPVLSEKNTYSFLEMANSGVLLKIRLFTVLPNRIRR